MSDIPENFKYHCKNCGMPISMSFVTALWTHDHILSHLCYPHFPGAVPDVNRAIKEIEAQAEWKHMFDHSMAMLQGYQEVIDAPPVLNVVYQIEEPSIWGKITNKSREIWGNVRHRD